MNLSRGLFSFAAVLCFAALPACNSGGSPTNPGNPVDPGKAVTPAKDKTRVAIVTNNPEEFWTYAEAGARKASKDFDVDVSFRRPERGDVGVQMNIVRTLVGQDFQGIAVSVIDPQEQAPELKQIAAKTKLITMDNDADGSDRICYVGTDNYAAGRAVGRLVKQVMPQGGTIAIFVGQITPVNARQRRDGVLDELAGEQGAKAKDGMYGKYKLHTGAAITDGAKRTQAVKNATVALGDIFKEKDICLIGLWAYNPPAILEAVRSSKDYKHAKIVGFDEGWETLDGIESGEIAGTVVQDPFNFGYKSVEVLAAEAKGDTSKRLKDAIPYRVVTHDGSVPPGETGKGFAAGDFRKLLKDLLASVPK